MGAVSSSDRQAQAMMELMARNIVKSKSTCLASAENKILIDIGSASSAVLNNVIITQVAQANARCESNASLNIDIGDLNLAVSRGLTEANTPKNLIDKIVREMNVASSVATSVSELVSSCVASSVNDFRVMVGQVKGTVTIMDLSLEQIATARVAQCLNNVRIGDVPLRQFLAQELPTNPLTNLPSQLALDAPCTSVQSMYTAGYIVLGGTGVIVLAILISYLLWMRATTRRT